MEEGEEKDAQHSTAPNFSGLGLSIALESRCAEMGLTTPTEIQVLTQPTLNQLFFLYYHKYFELLFPI
jgi:superfamily II DNA/RNA helicase